MAPGMAYDDSGPLASYFGVTCLALLLFPATYFTLKPAARDPLKRLCHCSECKANAKRLQTLKNRERTRRLAWRVVPLVLAWLVFLYMGYTIYKAPRIAGEVVYNPFEILGLGTSSTEKEIKKHYKKLSLQFHPDKIKLSENQTQEDADSKFVELTKAYKSLTDEVTRENLAKYGNPDGPQQREDKIAIPKWVVEGKNSIWVLAAYGLVLGGGIPWVVGRWWFFQRRLTRDGILNPTAELFFHSLREDTDFTSLIALLASAVEFQAILGGKRKLNKKEKKERQAKVEALEKELEERKTELGIEEAVTMRKESRITVSSGAGKRAQALLWAHLLRIEPSDPELRSEILEVLRITPPLLSSLVTIALSHNWLATSLLCIKLQPSLVQALPAGSSPLAQLPGFVPEKATEVEIKRGLEGKKWLEKWVKKEQSEPNEDGASKEALEVAKSWPRLEIVDAEFKVTGEKIVPPSAIVSLTYRCRYVYPETPRVKSHIASPLPNGDTPKENGVRAGSVTDVEDSLIKTGGEEEKEKDVLSGGDVKEKLDEVKEVVVDSAEKVQDAAVETAQKAKEVVVGTKGKVVTKEKEIPNGYAHAPHWPQLRKPHYYVMLGDSKLDKVIVQPTRITDIPFPKPDGTPSEPKEFSLQFQAPPQANLYSFVAHWSSDTFLGSDVSVPVTLKVEDPVENADSDEEDISDPEEDTLAGQMAMMRGGKVKASAGGASRDEDEDDESGSEDEYESSSDEEGPKRKRAINEDSETDSD